MMVTLEEERFAVEAARKQGWEDHDAYDLMLLALRDVIANVRNIASGKTSIMTSSYSHSLKYFRIEANRFYQAAKDLEDEYSPREKSADNHIETFDKEHANLCDWFGYSELAEEGR